MSSNDDFNKTVFTPGATVAVSPLVPDEQSPETTRRTIAFDKGSGPSFTVIAGIYQGRRGFYWPATGDKHGDLEVADMVESAWLARN